MERVCSTKTFSVFRRESGGINLADPGLPLAPSFIVETIINRSLFFCLNSPEFPMPDALFLLMPFYFDEKGAVLMFFYDFALHALFFLSGKSGDLSKLTAISQEHPSDAC